MAMAGRTPLKLSESLKDDCARPEICAGVHEDTNEDADNWGKHEKTRWWSYETERREGVGVCGSIRLTFQYTSVCVRVSVYMIACRLCSCARMFACVRLTLLVSVDMWVRKTGRKDTDRKTDWLRERHNKRKKESGRERQRKSGREKERKKGKEKSKNRGTQKDKQT